ncbi:MAG: Crp/Fnr family transcriptional regulator [Silvibacterium sp.]|nr:Crp/Fnr family transcriptional regulator [Silvibacterium sp.]
MHASQAVELQHDCRSCTLKHQGFFCDLTPEAARDFDVIRSSTMYPGGTVLFLERDSFRGVYLLCTGKIKLTISSRGGKTLILRLARPGEVLGLMAAISGTPYEATAETMEPCQLAFIRNDDFSRFVHKYPEVYRSMLCQISAQYFGTCRQIRNIALSASSRQKLARLLLDWSADGKETSEGTRISVPLTHEQIAECVGSTRETITRILSEFKNRHLVALRGATIVIPDRSALAAISGE